MKITLPITSFKYISYANNYKSESVKAQTANVADNIAFKSKITILTNSDEPKTQVVSKDTNEDIFGYCFEILGAKIKNLSTCNAVDRDGNYFWGDSRLVDTLVRGSIEAEGVSPLLLENTRVKGDIFSNQTGKKIVLSKSSVLHQDLLATSKGNTELQIKDRSLVLGNIVCGNFYEKCDNPSVLIKDRSKIMGMVIMGSDSGKVLIDGGIVKDIKFETLMTRSRYQNPVVEIKNNGIVERDIFFRNNRGKVIIEEGSNVKGYIMNADIVNVDKTGKVIKR